MKAGSPVTLRLYRAATAGFGPFAGLLLARRQKRGKEDAARKAERLGIAGRPRPEGRLCWLHGASVGEAVTILPVAERLAAQGFRILLTTGTVTSAALMAQPDVAAAGDLDAKLDRIYARLFGRNPTADERAMVRDYLKGSTPKTEAAAWQSLAQALFMANEFAFVD